MKSKAKNILDEAIQHNHALYERHKAEFEHIFNRPLADYWDDSTGFKIIGFDEALFLPDNEPMSQFLAKNYGERAMAIIVFLLRDAWPGSRQNA